VPTSSSTVCQSPKAAPTREFALPEVLQLCSPEQYLSQKLLLALFSPPGFGFGTPSELPFSPLLNSTRSFDAWCTGK
jgi:hypothetical protein